VVLIVIVSGLAVVIALWQSHACPILQEADVAYLRPRRNKDPGGVIRRGLRRSDLYAIMGECRGGSEPALSIGPGP
jgi:hypothetical protein